jgi:hypothetical protein
VKEFVAFEDLDNMIISYIIAKDSTREADRADHKSIVNYSKKFKFIAPNN